MFSRQKLGLALSGGGFRASLFHLGVLAYLADRGLLRHVEAISTVSGGSIVGAYYYLYLKRLLESKRDEAIRDQDYQALVAQMLSDFVAAIQKNLRLRTFLNPIKNLKMARSDYSRSDRLGELLDDLFYRPALGRSTAEPVLVRELLIQPPGQEGPFHPDHHNAARSAKVPVLLINATTLNTGRNWRFEAARMGEPPKEDPVDRDVDKRFRLERPPSYEALAPKYKDMPLGHAVAASAAVPGIFRPLALSRMYSGVRVELVDGGVHDNQGVQGLIDRGCTQFIISDGSGQMEGETEPATAALPVLARSNSVLMARVREEQMLRLDVLQRRGCVAFLHLKKAFRPASVPFESGAKPRRQAPARTEPEIPFRYGAAPKAQEAMARLRTDLDAFHDAESFSLMIYGYNMAASELPQCRLLWTRQKTLSPWRWPFMEAADLLARPTPRYLRVLRVGGSVFGKTFALYPKVTAVFLAGAVALLGWLFLRFRAFWFEGGFAAPAISNALVAAVVVGLAALVGWRVLRLTGIGRPLGRLARVVRSLGSAALAAAVSLLIALYLLFLNPLYLRAGNIERLQGARRVGPGRAISRTGSRFS